MSTFRSYAEALQTGVRWAKGFYGIRLTGTIALHCDLIAEGVNEAIKARFPKISAPDAYPYIGGNVNLERFPNDTDATYRDRLSHGFSIWQQAGTKQGLERGFDFFGFPYAQVYEDKDWQRPPKPYWSQFWVVFPDHAQTGGGAYGGGLSYGGGAGAYGNGITYPGNLNPVTGSGATYGSAGTYGSGSLYGISGITAEQVEGLRRLVRKWKRSASICREMIFEISSQYYGSGHTYGDGSKYGIVITYGTGHIYGDGSQYGGAQAIISGI